MSESIRYDRSFFERLKRESQCYDFQILTQLLNKLHQLTSCDVLLYAASYITENPSRREAEKVVVSDQDIPKMTTVMEKMGNNDLLFIIHSPGGSGDAAAQIIEYIRKKYAEKKITAVVPHKAMSAATMMCMGCDNIILSKLASLGPIDPQFAGGIPASTILAEKEEALRDIENNQSAALFWNKKLEGLPPGIYQICRDAMSYSQEVVQNWLTTYMFHDNENKESLAQNLSEWLANGAEHKSYGRPFTYEILKKKGFLVEELEENQEMQNLVMGIFHSFRAVFENKNLNKLWTNHLGNIEYS